MLDVTAVVCSLLILSFLSICINSFCIYVINIAKSYRSRPSSIFVVNLLATHLFQAIIVLPLYAGKKMKVDNLHWSHVFADGFLLAYLLSFYGVCLGTLSISIDRFLAAYLVNRYNTYVTPRNVLRAVFIMWLYVSLLCLIPFIPESEQQTVDLIAASNPDVSNNISTTKYTRRSSVWLEVNEERKYYRPQDEWTVFMLFFNAALPLVITVLCYAYVIYRMRQLKDTKPVMTRHRMSTKSESGHASKKVVILKEVKQYKQVTYLAILLCSSSFIMWSPSIIYYTILSVAADTFVRNWEDSSEEKFIVYIIKYTAFLSSLFSPIAYGYRHPDAKKVLNRIKCNTLHSPAREEGTARRQRQIVDQQV